MESSHYANGSHIMSKRRVLPRVSLSKSQTQEGVGAELFSLCQGITADGKLCEDEILALGRWLRDNQQGELPSITFLSATLNTIIADGRVTRDEQRELMEALEKVLPPEVRQGARAARKQVEATHKAREKVARAEQLKQEKENEERRWPEDEFDFMIAGVHFEGRHAIIEKYLQVGDRVRVVPEPDNPHDECAVAITLTDRRKIGYVPRTDSMDVSGCIDDGGYYVAKVKKILRGGRVPIPVIILQFFARNQLEDIMDLEPHPSSGASPVRAPHVGRSAGSLKPWWKFW